MAADMELLRTLAQRSLDAEQGNYEIQQFYLTHPELTVEDGYAGLKLRMEMMQAQGHKWVGCKLGGTSLAKLQQIASTLTSGEYTAPPAPTVGQLMDYMELGENEDFILDDYIHPKLEAELAFVLGKELFGPNVQAPDVMMATDYVTAAFEIIDSRFKDFKMGGKADAIIDNVSSRAFKLGRVHKSPFEVDMTGMGVRTSFNGEFTGYSAAGAVMGHPARAIASLCKTLYEQWGIGLPAGSVILTGAICASHPLKRGDKVVSDFEGLGSIWLNVV